VGVPIFDALDDQDRIIGAIAAGLIVYIVSKILDAIFERTHPHLKRIRRIKMPMLWVYVAAGAIAGALVYSAVAYWQSRGQEIAWTFEDPATINAPYVLGLASSGGQEAYVITIQMRGRNISGAPIMQFDGFIRSDRTNREIPMFLNYQGTLLESDRVNGIPAGGAFDLDSQHLESNNPQRTEGLGITQFLIDFPSFTFVFRYDGKTYQHQFTEAYLKEILDRFNKDRLSGAGNIGPVVTPKR